MYTQRLSPTRISYTNKRNQSGYKISNDWIIPNSDDAPLVDVVFDEKVFEEFFKLFNYYKYPDIQIKEVERFYNKYGPLQAGHKEMLLDIIDFIDALRVDSEKIKNGGLPEVRYRLPYPSLKQWEDGQSYLTFNPYTLHHAIYTAFLFGWYSVQLTECKYMENYGPRKDCKMFFEARSSKKFCSDACRAGYYMKKGRKKKTLATISGFTWQS